MKPTVRYCRTLEQASRAAADVIEEIIRIAVADRGFSTVVLTGGRTPQRTYMLLGEPVRAAKTPWQQCHLFWGDERWVPPDHPDSNYRLADEALLNGLHIPSQNIHRITTDDPKPEDDAASYEKHLRNFFREKPFSTSGCLSKGCTFPVFDLILLGMGPDGHTASLFPGSPLLSEKRKWVAAVSVNTGSPPVPRITLTLPVLNQAKNVLFLIAGKQKKAVLESFLDKPWSERAKLPLPAAHVNPGGRLLWIVAEKE